MQQSGRVRRHVGNANLNRFAICAKERYFGFDQRAGFGASNRKFTAELANPLTHASNTDAERRCAVPVAGDLRHALTVIKKVL
jgi:hypothetical protein